MRIFFLFFTIFLSFGNFIPYNCGSNSYFELATENTATTNNPVFNTSLQNIQAVTGGNGFSSYLTMSNTVLSVGFNGFGQLGVGGTTDRSTPTLTLLDSVTMISAGDSHLLLLTSTGIPYSTGSNSNGRLCIGTGGGIRNRPTVIGLTNVVFVSAGNSHSLFITNTGQVYSCGLGTNGQLGLGSLSNQNAPTLITSLSNIVFAVGGFDNSFFINSTGSVFATGNNAFGLFGLSGVLRLTSPLLLTHPFFSQMSSISVNINHALFLNSKREVYAIGRNDFGQLGLGDFLNRTTPVLVATDASGISTSNSSSFISFGNQTLYSFGKNDFGQLCLGDFSSRNLPSFVGLSETPIRKLSQNAVIQSSYFLGCPPLRYGSQCQFANCFGIRGDLPNVCNSRGSCTVKDNCTCNEPYYGTDCSRYRCYGIDYQNSTVCSSNGACSSLNNCTCNTGWSGLTCFVPSCFGINATSPNVCSSNGVCSSLNNCTCNAGWTGANCSIPTCFGISRDSPDVCSSGGRCINPNQCICSNSFAGNRCQFFVKPSTFCFGVQATSSSVCSGLGACIGDNQCVCNTFNTGPNCQYNTFHWDSMFSSGKWTDSSWLIQTDYGNIKSNRFPSVKDTIYLDLPGTISITLDVPLDLSSLTIGAAENAQYNLLVNKNQMIDQLNILNGSTIIVENTNVTISNAQISGSINPINSLIIYNGKLTYPDNIMIPRNSRVIINSDDIQTNGFIIEGDLLISNRNLNPNINFTTAQINSGSFNLFSNITLSNTFINITNGNFNIIGGEMKGNGVIYNYGNIQVLTNNETKTNIYNGIQIFNYKVFEITGGFSMNCTVFEQGPSSLFSLRGSSVYFDSPLNITKGSIHASGFIYTSLLNITSTDIVRAYSDKQLYINGTLFLGDTTTLIIELSDTLKNQDKILMKGDVILNGLIYLKVANFYSIEVGNRFRFLSYKSLSTGKNMKLMLIGSAYKTAKFLFSNQASSSLETTKDLIRDEKGASGLEIALSIGNLEYSNFYRCHYMGSQRIIEIVHLKENKKVALTITTPAHNGWSAFGINSDRNTTSAKILASYKGRTFEILNHTRMSSEIVSFIDTGAFQAQSLFAIGKEYLSMTMFLSDDDLLNQKYLFYAENKDQALTNISSHSSWSIDEINLLKDEFIPCTNFLSPNRLETRHPASIAVILGLYLFLFILCVVLYKFQPLYSRGLAPITTLFFLAFQLGFEARNYDFIPNEQRSLCLYMGYILFPLQQISFVMIIFYFIRYFSIIYLNTLKNNVIIVNQKGKQVTLYSWRVVILKQLSKLWIISLLIIIYVLFTLILTTIILASFPNFICHFKTISVLKIANSVLMLAIFLVVFAIIIGDMIINYNYIIRCHLIQYIFRTDPYFFRVQIFMFLPFMIYTLISEVFILVRIQSIVDIIQLNLVTEILNTINYNLLLIIEVVFPIIITFYKMITMCRKPAKQLNVILELLNNPEGLELFIQFSKKEFSVENVYAWKDCTDFKKSFLRDKQRMKKVVKKEKIIETTLSDKRISKVSSTDSLKDASQGDSSRDFTTDQTRIANSFAKSPVNSYSQPRESTLSEKSNANLSSPEELREYYLNLAQDIYLRYFNGNQSMFEVNVTKTSCQLIYDQIILKMIDETLFDEIVDDIMWNIKDSYLRFEQTKEFILFDSKIKLSSDLLEKNNDTFIGKKIEEKKKIQQKQELEYKKGLSKAKMEEIARRKKMLKDGELEFFEYEFQDESEVKNEKLQENEAKAESKTDLKEEKPLPVEPKVDVIENQSNN